MPHLIASLSLAVILATPLAAQDIPLIDPGEPLKGWNANNGAEFPGATVELIHDQAASRDGKPTLKLTADLTKGGGYCDMGRDVSGLKLDVESVSFWLKAPGASGITMRLVDANRCCHQIKLTLDPPSDDWRLVSFPIKRFFDKRGTSEAVQGVIKYERWGGKKGSPEGFASPLRNFILLTGKKDERRSIWVSDAVATVRAGTTQWREGFETASAVPPGWSSRGDVAVTDEGAFEGSHQLELRRAAAQREVETEVATSRFGVAPGEWQVSAALATQLESPDASFSGSLHFESFGADGSRIERVEVATPYGETGWKVYAKKVRTRHGTASGRFVLKLNKTVGSFRADELRAEPLDTRERPPAIDRIVLDTPSLGNLLLPDAERRYDIRVESSRALADDELTLSWTIRDYWGAPQAPAAEVSLADAGRDEKTKRFRYTAAVDFSAVSLEQGRYYEFHAEVPLSDNDPFRNSSGLAILPEAPAKAFDPIEVPFTSRNWDNRIGEYITLADRLGFRIIGLWGGADHKPPHKVWAPQIERCAELGAAILTGSPARINDIEYHRKDWQRWMDEDVLRGATRAWLEQYGDHQPGPVVVNLGNEPHGTGQQVLDQVWAYKIVYDEIKQVKPDTIVVATSVGPNREYFEAGYHEACDAFDFHVYESPEAVRRQIRGYQALMKEFDCEDKQIWSTELGLNSQGLTRQHIARDMVRKFGGFFAEGGFSMSWFDLLYPDPEGKALGTSGDSFNMFDSRYRAYAARLDAISCYNLINGILDKDVVAERSYDDGSHLILFRNESGNCFLMAWRDAGRTDAFLPLPGVEAVKLTAIDGRISRLDARGEGLTLSWGLDPVLLAYDGPADLPTELGEPKLRVVSAPERIQRGAPGELVLAGADPAAITVTPPPTWSMKSDSLRYTLTPPEGTPAREGDIVVLLREGDAVVGQLSVRPVLTGQLAVEVAGIPAPEGGRAAVRVTIANQSSQEQVVTWAVTLASESVLVDGQYAAPVKTSAYLAESGNGSLRVAPKQAQEVIIPVAGTTDGTRYALEASITDSTGAVIRGEGELRP